MNGVRTRNVWVIGIDSIGSCKSNYHMITTISSLLGGFKERLFNLYSHYKCYMPYSSTLSSSIYILFVFYCSFLWLNFAISRKCISKHIIKQVLLIKFRTLHILVRTNNRTSNVSPPGAHYHRLLSTTFVLIGFLIKLLLNRMSDNIWL
jgi:hypothetical protein